MFLNLFYSHTYLLLAILISQVLFLLFVFKLIVNADEIWLNLKKTLIFNECNMINFFNLRQEKNDSFYSDHFSPEKRRMRSRDSIGPISVHCHSGYDSRPGGWRSDRNRSILIDHWLDQVHCDGPNADWLFWRRCFSREQFYHGPFHVKSGRIVAAGMSRKLSIFSINSAVDRIHFSSGTRRALKFEINSIKNIWSKLWCLTTTC